MNIRETNRAKQIPIEKEAQRSVNLIDIDTTIAEYMSEAIIPELDENGSPIKVPLIYGNAERWEGARKNGYLRDQRGRIQIPLVMFKRNSIARDESIIKFKDGVRMPSIQKYSAKNRYERFSLQNNVNPVYQQYDVAMPSYVTVTYEVMIWTGFTEHMNKIVESFQYAADRYWGNPDAYKFRVRIDNFDNQQEVGEGSERVIRTAFTLSVNAYLLPAEHANKPTVNKSFTAKKVVFGVETDLTGGILGLSPSLYNEYAQIIDFVAVRGSQTAEFVNTNTVKLTNVKKPILPSELVGSYDIINWFRIYINGDFISPTSYTYTYNGNLYEIVFTFTGLSYALDENDEIVITGKFLEL
jgi:hypothetical protein